MDQCDDVRLKIVDLMNDFLSIKMKRNTFPFLRFISSGNWNERRNYERQTEFPTPETQDVEGWSLTCESVTPPPQNYIYLLSSIQYFKLILFFIFCQNNNKKCIVLLRFFALRLFFLFPLFTHWCLCKIFVLIASFVLEIVTGRMINLFKTQPCLLLLQV